MKKLYYLLLCGFLISSCQPEQNLGDDDLEKELISILSESADDGLDYYKIPESHDFQNIPQDPRNELSVAKVALGEMLFHETGLAKDPKNEMGMNTYSCASCHHAGAGFQAGIPQGIGEGDVGFGRLGESRIPHTQYSIEEMDIQPIRSPSVLNVAYQELMLWNGQFGSTGMNEGTEASWTDGTPKAVNKLGYEGVETQAIAGLEVHRLKVDTALIMTGMYKTLFDEAFGNVPQNERYSLENTGLAIAAYERTVLANQSRFQKWLRNEIELTSIEKKGALLFFGEAECVTCHTGPALNSMEFYSIGLNDLDGPGIYGEITSEAKTGRGAFTNRPGDMYKFKVPQLYALKQNKFYGHGASFNSIRDLVAYKNEGIPQNPNVPMGQISSHFKPLGLSEDQIDALTVFLEITLDDENLNRYVPHHLPSGQCFPNNDEDSSEDLGCN